MSTSRESYLGPYDLEAERAVLGSALIDPDTVPLVEPLVAPEDCFSPAHATILAAIYQMRARQVALDLVSLAGWLRDEPARRMREAGLLDADDDPTAGSQLAAAGGPSYLASLTDEVPTTAHVETHARRVYELARRREAVRRARDLFEAVRRGEDAASLALRMREGSDAVGATRSGEGARTMADVAAEGRARFDRRRAGDKGDGLTTGIPAFDQGGMLPWDAGKVVMVGGRPSSGKAQPLDAGVLTPRGFVPMGQIAVGDEVIGPDGAPRRVVGVYPQGVKPVWRVTTDDGASTECCDDHLWFTQTRNERRRGSPGSVKAFREIRATFLRPGSASTPNHALPVVAPVRYAPSPEPLPLDPYVLGLLLGDGSWPAGNAILHNPEPDVQARFASRLPDGDALTIADDGITCRVVRAAGRHSGRRATTRDALTALGLDGLESLTKLVPEPYLRASVEQRLDLLRGLIDSDGYVGNTGRLIEYSTSSPRLRDGAIELVRSLGGTASCAARTPHFTYRGERRAGQTSYRIQVSFQNGVVPVSSAKHLARWSGGGRASHRSIARFEPAGEKPCQCIRVDAPDGLYVTDGFIVTHNTSLVQLLAQRWASEGRVGLFASCETTCADLSDRGLALETRLPLDKIIDGSLGAEHDLTIAAAYERMAAWRLRIDDGANMRVSDIRRSALRIKAREGRLDFVVIDYLQIVKPARETNNRDADAGAISRDIKQLAKELGCPIIVVVQLSRKPEARTEHRPVASDLRESGQIEQDGDVIILLYRECMYDRTADPTAAEGIVAKQKNGPTFTAPLHFDPPCARYDDPAEWEFQHAPRPPGAGRGNDTAGVAVGPGVASVPRATAAAAVPRSLARDDEAGAAAVRAAERRVADLVLGAVPPERPPAAPAAEAPLDMDADDADDPSPTPPPPGARGGGDDDDPDGFGTGGDDDPYRF